MTLSYDAFIEQIQLFVRLSDSIKDGWSLRTLDRTSYLHKSITAIMSNDETVLCDYDVIHSPTYTVPVLYFTIARVTGERLPMETLWSYLPCSNHVTDKWTFVTATEHPLLGTPYYHIHPCHTNTLMSTISSSKCYLLTWLSTIGPLVGLTISIEYYQLLGGTTPSCS
jgi:ubiquitin-like-conjugating enzyme ATG10